MGCALGGVGAVAADERVQRIDTVHQACFAQEV